MGNGIRSSAQTVQVAVDIYYAMAQVRATTL